MTKRHRLPPSKRSRLGAEIKLKLSTVEANPVATNTDIWIYLAELVTELELEEQVKFGKMEEAQKHRHPI